MTQSQIHEMMSDAFHDEADRGEAERYRLVRAIRAARTLRKGAR